MLHQRFVSTMALNRYLIVFLLVFVFFPGHAQKIDSLKSLLTGETGAKRVEILRALAYEYVDVNNEMAKQVGFEAFLLASNLRDSTLIVKAGLVFASPLRRLGLVDSAIQIYSTLIPMARDHKLTTDLMLLLNSLGLSYLVSAQYDKALQAFFESLEMRKRSGTPIEIERVLSNIGNVYYKLKDYDAALIYYYQCLAAKNRRNDRAELNQLYSNIAHAYSYKNDLVTARYYVDKSIDGCRKENCPSELKMATAFCLGFIYYNSNNFKDAEIQFFKSYRLAKNNKNARFQLDNIDLLSQIHLKRDNIDEAIEYLKEAEELIRNGAPYNLELIKIYNRLCETYRRKDDFRKVAFYQAKYIQLKDSIYNEELTTNLMKISADYVTRENKMRIASQEQVLMLNKKVMNNQKLLNVFFGCMAVMAMLLVVLLFKSNKQKRMINKVLDEKVKQRTRQLEENQNALLRASEEKKIIIERTSLDMKSSLASIKGLCHVALHEVSDPDVKQYIIKVNTMTGQLASSLGSLQRVTDL